MTAAYLLPSSQPISGSVQPMSRSQIGKKFP